MMHMLIKINSYKREMTIFKLNKKLKTYRSSPPEVLLSKGVLKICSKSTGEHHAEVRFQVARQLY